MADLETIPPRLALMAFDADSRIRFQSSFWQPNLDSVKRPAALIEMPDSESATYSTGLSNPSELYRVVIVGKKLAGVESADEAAQTEIRQIVKAVLRYLRARPRLAFSNLRTSQPARLPDLDGVIQTTFTRGSVGLIVTEGEGSYWGGSINCTVEFIESVEEVLVLPS